MKRIDGCPVLTAAEMRAAEAAAAERGDDADVLMARAGEGIAEAVARLAAGAPIVIACGPGGNGGDGYAAATILVRHGASVGIASLGEPRHEAAARARGRWSGPVLSLAEAAAAPVLVDALFGTGLSRPLVDDAAVALRRLAEQTSLSIAVDLPSGLSTDDGRVLSRPPRFDLTLALGAPKPSHLLQPAARWCGTKRLIDIGIAATGQAHVIDRPGLRDPGPDDQKYTRGMVAILAGAMPGAAELASVAAMRAGAGYVALFADRASDQAPHAIVRRQRSDNALDDDRIGCAVVGPGLGRDDAARAMLDQALRSDRPLLVDGDALHLTTPARLAARADIIVTPHAGEFDALFGKSDAGKTERARNAARLSGAVVVFKGADTVIAAPDGRIVLTGDANDWLSTAGSGDVLAGTIAAMRASGLDAFAAAQAGVWLHGMAARRLGAAFIADDLAAAIGAVRARL